MTFRFRLTTVVLGLLAGLGLAGAQTAHDHKEKSACADLSLACAASATPAFGPDGALWIAARVGDRILVVKSADRGRTFSPGAVISPERGELDKGPDSRPALVIDRNGQAVVGFATRDDKMVGVVYHARSADGGASFSAPVKITPDAESQRFAAMAIDADGGIFSAWIDKRGVGAAKAKGEPYAGAALAFAWSTDAGSTFAPTRIAHDHTCECCRIGVGFAASGRPVVVFRNIFDGGVRDHALLTFADRQTPDRIRRVSADDWATDSCPHHGPSLAATPDGALHVAWFTNGRARKGLFYARSADGGETFSDPMPIGRPDRAPSRPNVVGAGGKIWLAWKEFDGEETSVMIMVSGDKGAHWSEPKAIAVTGDQSDHPILVSDGARAYLSWQTQKEGYRLLALDGAS